MKYKSGVTVISACCLVFAISACMTATGEQPSKTALSAEVLMAGRQCPPAPKSWTAHWIASPDQLNRMIDRCLANQFGITPKEAPAVDFERFGVLAVEMGRQRSAGYGFDTRQVTAYVESDTAVVILEYHEPAPGSLTAQMLTSPWIMIGLTTGPYHRVRVVDRNSRSLTEISINMK